jgi:DNA-binding NarL/FixJ family response regulator
LSTLSKVVVYAGVVAVEPAVIALDTGASGYILKTADDLVQGLRAVAGGEGYITNGFSSKVIAAFKDETTRKTAVDAAKLSVREMQIVRLLMLGQTNKQIAANIRLSEKTVKHYMTILLQKLNVRNRVEAVIAAQKIPA